MAQADDEQGEAGKKEMQEAKTEWRAKTHFGNVLNSLGSASPYLARTRLEADYRIKWRQVLTSRCQSGSLSVVVELAVRRAYRVDHLHFLVPSCATVLQTISYV